MHSDLPQRLRSTAVVGMAVEAAVPTEVEAAAFMEAVEADSTAEAECLAGAARHTVAAASAEEADHLAADTPPVQVSLNAAVANLTVRRWDIRATWDAPARWDVQAAAQPGPADHRLMPVVRTDSAEAGPAIRVPRTMQATAHPMGSGIPSAAARAAAQDPQARSADTLRA